MTEPIVVNAIPVVGVSEELFPIPEFLNDMDVRAVGRRRWMLLRPLAYVTYVRGYPQLITMQVGYVSDLSSIPWWARTAIPVNDYHRWAGFVHDWLFDHQEFHDFSREEVDAIFLEAMEIFPDLKEWRIHAMHAGVRIGAGRAWRNNPSHGRRDPDLVMAQPVRWAP